MDEYTREQTRLIQLFKEVLTDKEFGDFEKLDSESDHYELENHENDSVAAFEDEEEIDISEDVPLIQNVNATTLENVKHQTALKNTIR